MGGNLHRGNTFKYLWMTLFVLEYVFFCNHR